MHCSRTPFRERRYSHSLPGARIIILSWQRISFAFPYMFHFVGDVEGRGGRGGGSRGGSRGGFRSSRTSFRSRSNIRTSRGRFPAGWKVAAGVGLIYGWSSYRHRRSYRNDQSRGRSRSQARDVQPFLFIIIVTFHDEEFSRWIFSKTRSYDLTKSLQ